MRILRASDGAVFDGTPEQAQHVIAAGQGMLLDPARVFNPEDGSTYEGSPEQVAMAIKAGGVLEGTHAHKVASTGKLESFARGALQGLFGGFADEISGAVESVLSPKTYQQARDESRANFAVAEEANPVTAGLGNLAGGAASFLVPGMGALSKGGAIASGAKLGALYGAGNSTADLTQGDVGGLLKDVAQNAAVGAAGSKVFDLAGRGLSFAAQKGAQAVGQAFNPALQRVMAMGAKAKDLLDPRNNRVLRAQQILKDKGVFDRLEDGSLPSQEVLAQRIEQVRQDAAGGLQDLFAKYGNARVDLKPLRPMVDDIYEIIQSAKPSQEDPLFQEALGMLQRIEDTGGELSELWRIKKDTGQQVNWDQKNQNMSSATEIFRTINQRLGDFLESSTEQVAQQHGGDLGKSLAELNSSYAAAANTQEMLAKQIANNAASASILGQRFGDLAGGGIGASVGSLIGGPVGAAVGYGAATLGASAARSAEGRLWRAEVGEQMHQRQQQLAVALGAIPRTVDGVKQWVAKNMQVITQTVPQLAPMAQQLATQPPPAAEQTIRTVMPLLARFMAPSPYASELNGKISEPADRLTIEKQLKQMPGLSPSALAVRMSALNRDGTIPTEIYIPTNPQTLDEQMNDFASRLKALGY